MIPTFLTRAVISTAEAALSIDEVARTATARDVNLFIMISFLFVNLNIVN